MIPVNGSPNIFWHLVYLDGEGNSAGVKFNSDKAWNDKEAGFEKITINPASDMLPILSMPMATLALPRQAGT